MSGVDFPDEPVDCTCGAENPRLLWDHHSETCPNWRLVIRANVPDNTRVIRIEHQAAMARVAKVLDADSEFTTHHMDEGSRHELLSNIVKAVLGD